MNIKQATIALIMTATTLSLSAQTEVIAHRGFWDTPGAAQNSIAALVKADSIGCYGSEFDVWLSKDNVLIVNHDSSFKGKRMETSTAAELTALKLSNGENMPTLEAYLQTAKTLPNRTKLILELKEHNDKQRETEAIKQIIEMVKKYGLEDRMEYISFSLHATKEFIRQSPDTPVYYLNGELNPNELKTIGCAGFDYSMRPVKRNPEWIKQAHDLGMKVNVWTINKEKEMKWLIDNGVDFITTNDPLLLQHLLAR